MPLHENVLVLPELIAGEGVIETVAPPTVTGTAAEQLTSAQALVVAVKVPSLHAKVIEFWYPELTLEQSAVPVLPESI
jgi:hypothetical protein